LNNETQNTFNFDYIIIGSGVAGLHIAMQMTTDDFFKNKSIAIFDKSLKNINDKTFCFWEKGNGKWDNCVSKIWRTTVFKDQKNNLQIDLNSYRYKKINALDFYIFCKKKLNQNNSFSFFTEEVINIIETNTNVSIKTANDKTYNCKHIFDSRLERSLRDIKKEATYVDQSFKGWVIKTEEPVFNSESFTMMDYSTSWKGSTSFMYILPISTTEALFEYTFFAPFTISNSEFDNQINNYINNNLPKVKYQIKEIEQKKML